MIQKAPGKSFRTGLSLIEVMRMFPDDETAEAWFVENRWPEGVHCIECGSKNIQARPTRKPQPYRCRDCRKDFSVKTDSLMHNSKLGFQIWAIAIYLLATNLKGVSSMKLHRDFNITQKSAWHLAMRIRETWQKDSDMFGGPVEADETYVGGKRKNMPLSKRLKLNGRGPVGKTAVAGIKDRDTNHVVAEVVERTDAETLQGFVREHVEEGAAVYTDDAKAYRGIRRDYHHEFVKHSHGQYVRDGGEVHTNGMESFWSMLKRAHKGTFHKMSAKHLNRYVREFAGRHNERPKDTIEQIEGMSKAMAGKRLRYKDLIR